MLIVGMVVAVAWCGLGIFFVVREGDRPVRVAGCCPDCGCGRCTFHPPCDECRPPPLRRPKPGSPPESQEPYR